MRSDITAKAPENRRSRRKTPHNHALRIIDVMRCTALRRNRRRVVQAFRREPRLPLGQAGRSELQRSDLRQSLRRRGRRGLHAHLVPRPQTQWRLRPADEASPGKPGGAFGSPNRLWRSRAARLTFSNGYLGRTCNAAGASRRRSRLRGLRARIGMAEYRPGHVDCWFIHAADTRSRASSSANATKMPALPSPTPAVHCAPSSGAVAAASRHGRHQAHRRNLALRRFQGERGCGLSCARMELTGLASELSRE